MRKLTVRRREDNSGVDKNEVEDLSEKDEEEMFRVLNQESKRAYEHT